MPAVSLRRHVPKRQLECRYRTVVITLTSQTFTGLRTSEASNASAVVIVIALAAQTVNAAQIVVSSGSKCTRGKHAVLAASPVQIVATAAASFLQVVATVAPETAAASASPEWWIAASSRRQAF